MTVPRYVRAYWRWVSDFDSINYCSISRVTHLRTQREQRYTLELAIYDNRFRPRPTFPRCIYSVLKVILRPNRGSVKLRCRKIMENRFFFFFFFLSQSSVVVELESYRFVLSPMRSPKLWKHRNNFLIRRSDAMISARKRKERQVSHIAPITMCNNLVVDNLKNFLDHATVNRLI